jgi:hypothetical protein
MGLNTGMIMPTVYNIATKAELIDETDQPQHSLEYMRGRQEGRIALIKTFSAMKGWKEFIQSNSILFN